VFLGLAARRDVVGLQHDHHADAGAAQEDGSGQRLAGGVAHVSDELHEAETLVAEAVDGLDGDGAEGVGCGVEFMSRVAFLEREIALQSGEPVLNFGLVGRWRRRAWESACLEGGEFEELLLSESIDKLDGYIRIGEGKGRHLREAGKLRGG